MRVSTVEQSSCQHATCMSREILFENMVAEPSVAMSIDSGAGPERAPNRRVANGTLSVGTPGYSRLRR
jgi:hypothetical protein